MDFRKSLQIGVRAKLLRVWSMRRYVGTKAPQTKYCWAVSSAQSSARTLMSLWYRHSMCLCPFWKDRLSYKWLGLDANPALSDCQVENAWACSNRNIPLTVTCLAQKATLHSSQSLNLLDSTFTLYLVDLSAWEYAPVSKHNINQSIPSFLVLHYFLFHQIDWEGDPPKSWKCASIFICFSFRKLALARIKTGDLRAQHTVWNPSIWTPYDLEWTSLSSYHLVDLSTDAISRFWFTRNDLLTSTTTTMFSSVLTRESSVEMTG